MERHEDLDPHVRHATWVRTLARELVRDEHEAQDLVQDAWVASHLCPPRAPESWTSFIRVVLRNLARARWRARLRRAARERACARAELDLSGAECLERLDAHEALVRAVRALEEPYRQAILLRYFEGLKPGAMAARSGEPVRTIESRLHRALEKLRARLDSTHGGERRTWCIALARLASPIHPAPLAAAATLMTIKILAACAVALAIFLLLPRSGSDGPEPARGAGVETPAGAPLSSTALDSPAPGQLGRSAVPSRPEVAPEAARAAGTGRVGLRALHGSVVDAGGRPVSLTRVSARAQQGRAAPVLGSTLTDAAGDYRLDVSSAASWLDVDAEAWVVVFRPRVPESDDRECVFVVAPPRRIGGITCDSHGTAIAGVELACAPPPGLRAAIHRALQLSVEERWTARSDELGDFGWQIVPDLVSARLIARSTGRTTARIELDRGDQLGLRVVLEKSFESQRVAGRVVDIQRAPVAGAFVSLEGEGTPTARRQAARTDSKGRFALTIADPPRGRRRLVALGVGFAPAVLESTWDAAQRAEAWPATIELVLSSESLAIAGRVLHADGTPAARVRIAQRESTPYAQAPWGTTPGGATVWAELDTESLLRGPRVREILSTADGRFELGGLLSRAYRLIAIDPSTLDMTETAPIPAGSHDVEIRLQAGAPDAQALSANAGEGRAGTPQPAPHAGRVARIAGRLVDRSGAPVHGATVWLVRRVSAGREDDPTPHWHSLSSRPTRTDLGGEFEFADVSRAVAEIRAVDSEHHLMNRFVLTGSEDLGHLQLTMRRQCNFRIDLSRSWVTASSFAVIDAQGAALDITDPSDKGVTTAPRQPLYEQGSNPLLVSDDAAAIVFYDAFEAPVLTLPVTLEPGKVTIVRP